MWKDKTRLCMMVLVVIALCAILVSAGTSSAADMIFRIGVTQIVAHPGIDLVRNGFVEGMKERGFVEGKNVKYDFQNAQGQMPIASTIGQKFVNDRVDMIFSITTPSTQAVIKATKGKKIPIVFGAVTDPVSAGIVKSFEKPGGNITGTSDILPIKEQFELLSAGCT